MKIWITRKVFHRKFMLSVNVLERPSREYHDLSEVYKRFLSIVEDDLNINYDYRLSDDSKDDMILHFCQGSKKFNIPIGKENVLMKVNNIRVTVRGGLVTSRTNARDERKML